MPNRGSYVYKLYGSIFGASPKMLVLCNFIRKLMVSDKTIHRAFRTHTTLRKQNPLDKLLIFTIYQNLHLL